MNLMKVKDTALSYLKPAEKEVLQWFRKDFAIEEKSDKSPVTIADRNAEEILREKIRKDFPDHGIIGEEFGEEKSDSEWVWTIDPIDGTRSFVRGLPLFSSLIALLHHGEPVMGIISLPALGETAWAVKGKGAFCNDSRLNASPQKNLAQAVVATGDIYCFRKKQCDFLFNKIGEEAALVRIYPDAFGHLMAARGAVDVMVDPLAYIWDFAPCKIMIEEAGGKFANFTGNQASIRGETAIAGSSGLVQEIRKLYQEANSR